MLQKLISELRSGGSFEIKSLAARLKTTPEMVEAMLEHLRRSGYISAFIGCEVTCKGCALADACQGKGQNGDIRLWQG